MVSRLLFVAPSIVGSTPFTTQDGLSLQLLQWQATELAAARRNEPADLPGPTSVIADAKFHMPEMLEEKVLNIATVVESLTRSDLGTEVLAAVSREADQDHQKAHKLREKIVNKEKVGIADIVDVVSLLSKSQTAESAAANDVLFTSHDMSMLMGGFAPEDFGSNFTGKDQGDKLATFQGDLLSGDKLLPWPGGHVKYCFARDVSERVKQTFKLATEHYMQAMPCLTFEDVGWKSGKSDSARQYQNCEDSPALFVTSNPNYGCFSHRGMVKPSDLMSTQQLQLHDPACTFVGTVVHELGHALGLGHARPANATQVLHQKIQHGKNKNFEFDTVEEAGDANASLSIMHYDSHAFAADPKLQTLDGPDAEIIGQRVGLGLYDVASLSRIYGETASECVRSGLVGLGSIENRTIQCWKGRECPGANETADAEEESATQEDAESKPKESVWESIQHLVR